MAVTLRLTRRGQKKRPFYRIVAAEKTSRRDGRFIEIVGTYNPMVDPPAVTMKEDRVRSWVSEGAQVTELVRALIKKQIPGLVEERETKQRETIQAKRAKRKARASAAK